MPNWPPEPLGDVAAIVLAEVVRRSKPGQRRGDEQHGAFQALAELDDWLTAATVTKRPPSNPDSLLMDVTNGMAAHGEHVRHLTLRAMPPADSG